MEENNQKQEVVQEDPFANAPKVEQKFTTMGQVNESAPKKKKSKAGIVVFVLLLLLAIVGGVAYYYYTQIYTNPTVVYKQIVKTGINSLTTGTSEEITKLKAKTKLDVDIDLDEVYTEDENVDKILDVINNIQATLEFQMDTNQKKAVLKLDSDYEDEELLNGDILLDAENEEVYLKAEQFFDEILEVEMEEEDFDELKEAFEIETITPEQEKAIEIFSTEFVKIIKDDYTSKEKEKITANSKEVNADKYILKMTAAELVNELTTTIEVLKNNENFLNCFEEKDKIKQVLEDALLELDYLEASEDVTICVNLYRTGLKQEFVKVDFEVEADGQKLILEVEKIENQYAFKLSFEEETYCTGTVELEKINETTTKMNMIFEAEEIGTIAINMEVECVINEAIDTMDTKDSMKMEELSDADMLRVMANLQESKLYELIEEFSDISDDTTGVGEDDEFDTEVPSNDTDEVIQRPNHATMTDLEKNISASAEMAKSKKLVVFAKNNNTTAVDMDIEVEFYDENETFVGSSTNYLTAVEKGKEIAVEMYETPANFKTYKIYINAEETEETEYFDKIEMTHKNNGETIAIQVENKSEDTIEFLSVAVVYYKDGKVVGIEDSTDLDVKPGRKGNFNIDFPYDAEYNHVEFDDYKVYVTEAYSYNN